MSRASPPRNFNSSSLVRRLAELAVADVAEAKQSFAERLGEWLGVGDAITLHAALNSTAASASGAQSAAPFLASDAVQEEFARTRTALVDSITTGNALMPGQGRVKLPTPDPGASIESATDFSPYRRYYLAHQDRMESRIDLLRADVRAALAGHSAPLKQIAALDAALDKALAERERSLLSTVPSLLERRYQHLRQAHRQALVETRAADDAELWTRPGGWLAVFGKDLRGVLLAELDVRLQPVLGLIGAFGKAQPEKLAASPPPAAGVEKTRKSPA